MRASINRQAYEIRQGPLFDPNDHRWSGINVQFERHENCHKLICIETKRRSKIYPSIISLATMALLISFAACEGLGRHARSKHVACLSAHDGEAGYATGMMNLHDQSWSESTSSNGLQRSNIHEFHEGFSISELATQNGLGLYVGLRPSPPSPIHSQETLCQAHRDYRSGWRQYPKRHLRPTALYSVLQNQKHIHDAANPWLQSK